jgi:hypothetical protein
LLNVINGSSASGYFGKEVILNATPVIVFFNKCWDIG